MSRGAAPEGTSTRDLLQSSVSKPLRLTVSYGSFSAPNYEGHAETVVGRLWAYDATLDMAVLETGSAPPLAPMLRRSAAAAVYDAGNPRAAPGVHTGFKCVRGAYIKHADVLSDEELASAFPHVPVQPSVVVPVPVAAMEARDEAASKKCAMRASQLGPAAAGELGQTVFDALSKTCVSFLAIVLTQSSVPLA